MKIIGWIIATPFILLALFVVARFLFCGPDKSVEKVAFPLAKSVVEYTESKGVPKTLYDVENMPYELKCGNPNIRENNETDYKTKKLYVSYKETTQSCSFTNNKKYYGVYMRVGETPSLKDEDVYLDITHEKTLVRYIINHRKNQWIHKNYPNAQVGYGYGKRTGFCSVIRLFQ